MQVKTTVLSHRGESSDISLSLRVSSNIAGVALERITEKCVSNVPRFKQMLGLIQTDVFTLLILSQSSDGDD